jgi:methylase of polypeptide subunit release factors
MAAKTTSSTLSQNIPPNFNSVIQGDLLDSLNRFITQGGGGIDVLVFNPPYVPTSEDDTWAGDLGFAWKGGGQGMQTTWKVLDNLNVDTLVDP